MVNENLIEGTYYFIKGELFIKSKIIDIEENGTTLNIKFTCGELEVQEENLIKVRRPCNLIQKFIWCYILRNSSNEVIGYIGKAMM